MRDDIVTSYTVNKQAEVLDDCPKMAAKNVIYDNQFSLVFFFDIISLL